MTKQAILEKLIEEGNEARLIVQYAGRKLLEREEAIIGEMLTWFRSIGTNPSTNQPEIGVRYIAALSEVRALLEYSEHAADKGAQALAQLVSTSTEASE